MPITRDDIPDSGHLTLQDVSWRVYRCVAEAPDLFRLRTTYDQGNLDISEINARHGRYSALWSQLVTEVACERHHNIASFGRLVVLRKQKNRGVKLDACYWIQNELKVRSKMELRDKDLPPDLVIEIDVMPCSVNRLAIFQGFGFPEVWYWNGKKVKVLLLNEQGEYVESVRSIAFPNLRVAHLVPFLKLAIKENDTTMRLAFREWLNKNYPPSFE